MNQENAYQITWLVRRLFRAMSTRADAYLKPADLTAADRAVMEFLYPDTMLSVPDIARRYKVSRQHVQTTSNGLLQSGLLLSVKNPNHKRSPLMCLSDRGRETFAAIRKTETALLQMMFAELDEDDLQVTSRVLRTLTEKLDKE